MNIKLSTVVNPEYSGTKLNDNDIILGIGSCFAANILTKLLNGGFQGMSNPNGIVYNAVSIAKSLERIVSNKIYSEQDFFFYNNLWHSWEHHGSFSKQILNEAVNLANNSLQKFRNLLESSKCIIITPSSSVVYKHIKTSTITANCHKVPNGEFKRKLLTYSENLNALNNIINFIKKINHDTAILFTLSPVRHYPGDPVLNSVSKATLRSAINDIINTDNNVYYFPSYEILTDELRDYRYYKEDMLHPSTQAENIIFDKFLQSWIEKNTIQKIYQALKNLKAQRHIQN